MIVNPKCPRPQKKRDFFVPKEKIKESRFSEGNNANSYKNRGERDFFAKKGRDVSFFGNDNKEKATITMDNYTVIAKEAIGWLKSNVKIITFSEELDSLLQQIDRYELLCKELSSPDNDFLNVAVVGAFSCGKSSFINSILEENIEPVGPIPTNHANTYFTYGNKEIIKSEGKVFSREEYESEVQNIESEYKEFCVEYPCDSLKGIKMYDTPGFGSMNKNFESEKDKSDIELSKTAANNADILFFLIDINNGTIQESEITYLNSLLNKNIYIILTRADDKSPNKREVVKKQIIDKSGIEAERVFLYSSYPEKCNEACFTHYKEKVKIMIDGLEKKKTKKVERGDLEVEWQGISTRLIALADKIKIIDQKEFEKQKKKELEKNRTILFKRISEGFIRDNPGLFLYNENVVKYETVEHWYKNEYSIKFITDYNEFNSSSYKIFNNYSDISTCLGGSQDQLNYNIFYNIYKFVTEPYRFSEPITCWTEDGILEERRKIIGILQKRYSSNENAIQKLIFTVCKNHFDKEKTSFVNNEIKESFNNRWAHLDDLMNNLRR